MGFFVVVAVIDFLVGGWGGGMVRKGRGWHIQVNSEQSLQTIKISVQSLQYMLLIRKADC